MAAAAPAEPSPGRPVVEVEGVTKRFPGVLALDSVDASFEGGEIHAVVGQNGAGKSTLIGILSGMIRPDGGTVRVAGSAVDIRDPADAFRLGIATVYQELSLLPNLSVAQNLSLGREPRRRGLLDTGAMRERARAALERVGAGEIDLSAPVARLAIAERQLVEIAKGLSHDPALLILDEPTAALARREADRLFAVMRELKRQGLAILFVSHRFREVLDHCDRGTILRNGRLVETTPMAGMSEVHLTERMIGRVTEAFVRHRRPAAGEDALEARGLAIDGRLEDVSFAARRGEILALTGLLGAGQTEAARILGGALAPDRGEIALDGVAIPTGSPERATKAGICLLTDDRKEENLFLNLSLRDNITLPSLDRHRRFGFVDTARDRAAASEAAERLGIVASSIEAPVRQLSGGNQQKAIIARWLLRDSAAFVFIEPTRGVDVGARAEIHRRIKALAAAGKIVVVVSSDPPEVLALADRILVMRDGRIAAELDGRAIDEERLNLAIQGKA